MGRNQAATRGQSLHAISQLRTKNSIEIEAWRNYKPFLSSQLTSLILEIQTTSIYSPSTSKFRTTPQALKHSPNISKGEKKEELGRGEEVASNFSLIFFKVTTLELQENIGEIQPKLSLLN